MKEADLDKYLMAQLKKYRCAAIKLTTMGFRGSAGWPDRLIIAQHPSGQSMFFFLELKTERGRLTRMQNMRQNQLRDLGCDVTTVHGKEEVDWWLHIFELQTGGLNAAS